ncbi:unnamed protein product [Acanthoscelides obtectus]|uniref:Uncharacterized protein n=1 Tax=Acanthoscelides obtectus TaxID=200917 RepID=A0A9P0M1V6_ACAOB|nr:unnamed protein product [Acanthoscelides obtectus]CAH2004145.1 unnamed protein product [Acanthoscelides obtectus]CAK1640657.1 hypothetical protein AOBTE_LOCUS11848 [Acanthoscelides obtectus]CAK1650149.1 hypothetical protein AOBTE_LOCUS16638 [Acanthoscelides obtectus]
MCLISAFLKYPTASAFFICWGNLLYSHRPLYIIVFIVLFIFVIFTWK